MAKLQINIPASLKEELWLFLGITGASLVAGVLTERLLLCLLLGLLAYLAWHLLQLLRLPWQIAGSPSPDPPRPFGLWKDVFRELGALHTDIGQREHRLSDFQNRFQDAVSALPDAVVILGQTGSIEWMNPAAERLLGILYSDSSGQRLLDLVRDPILDEYLGNKAFEQPLVFSPPANRSRIVSLFATSLGGDQQQQMIVASDITRQYHLDSAQLDFVANISHELRTPLTVISGLLEQMQTGNSRLPGDQRSIELMQSQALRMGELIADLLTLSRLELNEQPPAADEIDVAELLTAIADEARTLGKASAHTVQLHIESAVGLRAERKDIHTAISSLVTNAIRHTPNRTAVDIRWRVDDAGGNLSITDNGEGIAARHLPRLTERLYRVDSSRSRDTGGTGLGLAIVKNILDRHGAGVKISSTVGRGSTFSCHFPADRLIRAEAVRDAAAGD
jgi:two-component system phosphate regulon sensor histidine kinase PhoR